MERLAVQDNRRPTHCLFPPNPDHPQPGDLVLDTLVGALRATVAHPDESVQMLAATTLSEVRRIQRAARRKLLAQQRAIAARRLDLLVEQIAAALKVDSEKLKSRARQQHLTFKRQIAGRILPRHCDRIRPGPFHHPLRGEPDSAPPSSGFRVPYLHRATTKPNYDNTSHGGSRVTAMARHQTPLELKGEVLTLAEVSAFLHVSAATIHRLLKAQHLPAFRVGREWRFYRQSIDHWRKELGKDLQGRGWV